MKHYELEEHFHENRRKEHKQERKLAQKKDRSKFKKTDADRVQTKAEAPSELPRGRVMAITGEGIWVEWQNQTYLCTLKGLFKKDQGQTKNLIAVGDWVRFQPTHEKEGHLVYIEERFSFLSRTDISGTKEQLIAVNIDQAVICTSVVNPPLKPALVDRYLIAAERGNIMPFIVINKLDLLSTDTQETKLYTQFLADYEPLGYPIYSVSTQTQEGVDSLRLALKDKTSVIFGQSGVGKSSLLNVCFEWDLKIGKLAQKTQKGSHTTTTAKLLSLPGGGYCVDTPGIRSFALWNLQKKELKEHFKDIACFAAGCKFPDCSHQSEPECAVRDAVKKGILSALRFDSFQTLLNDCLGGPDSRTKRKLNESN